MLFERVILKNCKINAILNTNFYTMQEYSKYKKRQKHLDDVLLHFVQNKHPLCPKDEYSEEFYHWEMETTALVGNYVIFLN